MEGVTGSIPVAPTKNNYNIRGISETGLAELTGYGGHLQWP